MGPEGRSLEGFRVSTPNLSLHRPVRLSLRDTGCRPPPWDGRWSSPDTQDPTHEFREGTKRGDEVLDRKDELFSGGRTSPEYGH